MKQGCDEMLMIIVSVGVARDVCETSPLYSRPRRLNDPQSSMLGCVDYAINIINIQMSV
jgi:hypothetical protein